MESFEDIQQQEFEHLTAEIGALERRLVELGWSREQVLAYVKELLTEVEPVEESEMRAK